MAPRPRRKKASSGEFSNDGLPSTDPLSPIALLKAFVIHLNGVADTLAFLSPEAPVNVTVFTNERGYLVKPITPDDEFTFKDAKLGAKHQIIFEFTPLDPTKFRHIEIDENKVFGIFPEFQHALAHAFDMGAGLPVSFQNTKDTWIGAEKANRQGLVKTEAQEKVATLASAYDDNPEFGQF